MGAITSAVIAIAGVIVGWITIEFACKPCLDKGREAIDRSLNPDYDPDDDVNDVRAPLNPNPPPPHAHILHSDPDAAASSAAPPPEEIKAV
ncbi:hypothetical protein TIFTF001_012453 [Ficus carica]|uniref:Outer envelope membrane protein 7 n=1 Tax=Ficus carica TaxID=3494 RepID=A0AA87ZVZ2_FICCA|nr:hypothetical protein TIFTF001_012453 [Ficus carica]